VLRQRAVRRVEVVFDPGGPPPDPPPAGLTVAQRSGDRLRGAWAGPVDPLLAWLARGRVRDLIIAPPDLEDLFLAYYADDLPEARQ
jgi:hypothetical protein